MSSRTILLIEDNEIDAFFTTKIIQSIDPDVKIIHCENGKEGLDYLNNENNLPWLILLDLMMPIMDGFTFLTELSANNKLNNLPVCILSTSDNPLDVEKAEDNYDHIKSYIAKPISAYHYKELKSKLGVD